MTGHRIGGGYGGGMADAVMVSSSFLPGRGGIESYLAELCEALAPRLAVLAAAERDGKQLPAELTYPTHPFPGRLLWPGSKAARATIKAARIENTDKILFGTPWPLVLMGPRLKTRGLAYAVIVHGAEMLVPSKIPGVRRKLARALAGAELLFAVSEYTASKLDDFISACGHSVPRIELLRARVDLGRFHPGAAESGGATESGSSPTRAGERSEAGPGAGERSEAGPGVPGAGERSEAGPGVPGAGERSEAGGGVRARYGIEAEDRVVLCFGRLVERKGVHRMIDAMPRIAAEVPGATLVVAGTGPEMSKLRTRAKKVGARVVFTGRVADEDAAAIYATAEVFALPVVDRWFGLEVEGLGVVLLEASACGVPCVTGRSGGTAEAVLDGETGYVIDATDQAALIDATVRLLKDRALATKMGAAGRRHVEREFSDRALPQALLEWLAPREAA